MREVEDTRPKRLCPHCNGKKVCNCDLCIQQGGICGACNHFGHLLVLDPAIPPEFGAAEPVAPLARRPKKIKKKQQ